MIHGQKSIKKHFLRIICFKYDTRSAESHRFQNKFANFQYTNSKHFCFSETLYSHSYKHPQNRCMLSFG